MSETILSDGGTSCIGYQLKMEHYQPQCKHCICPKEIRLSTNTGNDYWHQYLFG
ncbi:hypothetical protein [Phocaeicola dorei]|uniref:hypothetical protein n=1 Tax=Phocaeicola dorei TaxID=357276 RepID=UPI001BDE5DEF|nr:hypothetical protein [Phocaeicola dorei]MBT1284897.1 hypothetical protein [Phocaeicola dorei]MBT1288972.1 hypothetical protein [Phocaeicola dorei]